MKFSKIILMLVVGLILMASNVAKAGDSEGNFDAGSTAFHHVSDANIYTFMPGVTLHLPCILYDKKNGKWSVFSSSKFHPHGHHGDGTEVVDGYALVGGSVMKVKNPSSEMLNGAPLKLAEEHHPYHSEKKNVDGEEKEVMYFTHNGEKYYLEDKTSWDFGVFGGAFTSFYDFSITKNVMSMILVCLFLFFIFFRIAKTYQARDGKAPSGTQGFIEPIIVFIQDEVAKPFLGAHWKRFLPFLLTIFFFILGLNLFGQVPFLGGSNVTGSLSVTLVLALASFFVVNISGNSHYWEHIVWMPGVPAWLKVVILTPVEILGIFIKPVTLMLRLFANITAGHMVMVIFVSLIFIAREGLGDGGAYGTAIGSTLLTIFMMSIELLVAFIQAFVFTILTAAYLSAATEEAHDHDHDEAHAYAH